MNKRKQLDRLPIDAAHLHKLMARLFPKENNYRPSDGEELVKELHHCGVQSRKQVRLLLKRHRRVVINMDREPLDTLHQRIYLEEFGKDFIARFNRTRAWFTYEGLVRGALQLEFGDRYQRFADERDKISQQ